MTAFSMALVQAVGSLAAVFVLLRGLDRATPRWRRLGVAAGLAAWAVALWLRPTSLSLSNALVIVASGAGAALLARLLNSGGAIVAFSITVALVDLVSFFVGPTRYLLSSSREEGGSLLQYLAVVGVLDGERLAIIGLGDLVVAGALFQALCRRGHGAAVAAGTLAAAIVLALSVGWLVGGVPALPFVAAAAIACTAIRRRRRRS